VKLEGAPARSAIVSIVATQTAGPGYLQLLDCDDEPGATSNLNVDAPGQTRSTIGLVEFSDDGTACLFNRPATHEVADLQGYFADGAVDDIADERLLDTRRNAKPGDGTVTEITGGRANATGIVSLVASATTGPGYLSVVACDSVGKPTTSNLNWVRAGATVSGLAFVQFDESGSACVYNLSSTHVIADVQGYMATDAFDDLADQRLVDTRRGDRPADRSLTKLTGRPGATAVVSLVATAAAGPGYLQVVACDGPTGATSNVNYDAPGAAVSGLATVQFDADGEACVFARTAAHVVADLQGYFADGSFDDVADVRLLDTRRD
jgi:hypothetical protein